MSVQLIVPGLLWPTASLLSPVAGLALDGLSWLLGKGARRVRAFEPYDRQLAHAFRLEAAAGAPLPLATLRRLGEPDAEAPPANAHWLCADPVNLAFAREHLLLHGIEGDSLSPDDARTLVAALNEVFADLGQFEACAPTRWYLRLSAPTEVTLYPLDDVVGRPVKHFLPEGADAKQWQRTMNEAQIVLHNHALNPAREAAGQRAVNSIWLWGAGTLAQRPVAPAAAVQASDPLSIGLARAAGVAVSAPDCAVALQQPTLVVLDALQRPAQRLELDAWRDALAALEHDWFAPLAAALQNGTLDRLHVLAPSDRGTLELTLRGRDRWKFWRSPHPFEALLKSVSPKTMTPAP